MKCTVCNGVEVSKTKVKQEIPVGQDIVLVPIEVLVCQSCGERFYDRPTMRRLEQLEDELAAHKRPLREVGKILELA